MVDKTVAYGRGDSCSPDAPPSWVDFADNADESNENLTASVRRKAAGEDPIAFSLRAADEDDPNSWKRFRGDNAKLVVTYNTRPDKPTGERLTNPDEKTCTTDNTKRPWIRDATPTMSVTGTDADSHTDGTGQNLTAAFQVWDQVDEPAPSSTRARTDRRTRAGSRRTSLSGNSGTAAATAGARRPTTAPPAS